MASSEKAVTKFVNDERDDETNQSPPKWNDRIDSWNRYKLAR